MLATHCSIARLAVLSGNIIRSQMHRCNTHDSSSTRQSRGDGCSKRKGNCVQPVLFPYHGWPAFDALWWHSKLDCTAAEQRVHCNYDPRRAQRTIHWPHIAVVPYKAKQCQHTKRFVHVIFVGRCDQLIYCHAHHTRITKYL